MAYPSVTVPSGTGGAGRENCLLSAKTTYKLQTLCERLRGELVGDGDVPIEGLSSLTDARPGDISLYADPRYRSALAGTRASAIVTRERLTELTLPQVLVPEPHQALALLVDLFHPPTRPEPGVSPLASVSPDAKVGDGVSIGPFVCIGERASIGARAVLHPGVYIGAGASVGEDALLWPNVVIRDGCRIGDRVILHPAAVIGSDGFGFARKDGKFTKIRHAGVVVIEDDVEIGANAAIDRGTMGVTRVRRGVKIDNLVHIAHNVDIGEDSAMAAQVGISGSTVVGERVLIGGQAGLVDHLRIGDDAILIAQSGVIGDIDAGETVSGYPARPHREVLKATAALRGLERLRRRVRDLEETVKKLESLEKKS